jgi:hypothetical protein
MPAISLSDIARMQQLEEAARKASAYKSSLMPYFLSLFHEAAPLDGDDLDGWRWHNMIKTEDIAACVNEAVERGWIISKDNQLFITTSGKAIADSV